MVPNSLKDRAVNLVKTPFELWAKALDLDSLT